MRRLALIAALIALPSLGLAGEFFTLKGHGGPIKGIAVSPDGGAVLTASFDNALGLWQDGAPRWLEAHRAAVNVVRFVDESQAVSSGDDFTVLHWDLATDTARPLGTHKGKVLALAVSPDKRMVASASWDGTVGLYPLDGTPSRSIAVGSNVNDVAFSSDGSLLYTAAANGEIRIWEVTTGTARGLLLNNGFGVNCLVLNEAGGWLAFGAVDGVTKVVDLESAEPIADFTFERRPILALAATRDFSHIAMGDGHGFISIISTNPWAIERDFRATLRGPVWALAFSGDGGNIHAGGLDDAMYSWPIDNPGTGEKMLTENRAFLNGGEAQTNGERQFKRKCSICHTLSADSARRAGPSLAGVFGRRAGTLPGYSYSDTLLHSDIVWDAQSISALFDVGPDVYITGSKMPQQRITRAQDRADLVEFLRRFSP